MVYCDFNVPGGNHKIYILSTYLISIMLKMRNLWLIVSFVYLFLLNWAEMLLKHFDE